MQNVKDKNIIITGASSGIGEATARLLASHGANLMLAARREDRLKHISAEITDQYRSRVIYQVVDVANFEQVKAAISATLENFGKIDVLINNAGIMLASPLSLCETDDWDKTIDINIKGVLYGVAAVMPGMLAQGSGHIINIASVAGHRVFEGLAVYCATKHAVRTISESIRIESDNKIRSTIVSPGKGRTEIIENNRQKPSYDALKKSWKEEGAIDSEDVANAILYAISQPDKVDVNEILIRPLHQTR